MLPKTDLPSFRISWWKCLFVAVSIYSVLITLIVVLSVERKGGLAYAAEQVGLMKYRQIYTPKQELRLDELNNLPVGNRQTMFVGDSLTFNEPWSEYFSDIRNFGLYGDTTSSLLLRESAILRAHPRSLFLNIGTNDLAMNLPVSETFSNTMAFVNDVKAKSPSSKIYVTSILPTNPRFHSSHSEYERQKAADLLNMELKRSQKSRGYSFLDIAGSFRDGNGYLRRDLTIDGVHLNARGRQLYAEQIRPFLN